MFVSPFFFLRWHKQQKRQKNAATFFHTHCSLQLENHSQFKTDSYSRGRLHFRFQRRRIKKMCLSVDVGGDEGRATESEEQSRWCKQVQPTAWDWRPPRPPKACEATKVNNESRPHLGQVGLINTAALLLPYKWCLGRNVSASKNESGRRINPTAHIYHTATLWNEVGLCSVDEPAKKKGKTRKKLNPAGVRSRRVRHYQLLPTLPSAPIRVQPATWLSCRTFGPEIAIFFHTTSLPKIVLAPTVNE